MTVPLPSPSPSPSPLQHVPPPPFTPEDKTNIETLEQTGQGERETQGEVTSEERPRSPKMVQQAEGGKGKDKRERIIVVVRSPCQENCHAAAHTSAHKSTRTSRPWVSKPSMGSEWMHLVNGMGENPSLGQPTPE